MRALIERMRALLADIEKPGTKPDDDDVPAHHKELERHMKKLDPSYRMFKQKLAPPAVNPGFKVPKKVKPEGY